MAEDADAELRRTLDSLARSRTDQSGWTELYRLLWPTVYSMNYRMLHGHEQAAEEASQDVFVRLASYCRFSELRNPRVFRSYLAVTCRNAVCSLLRRAAKSRELPLSTQPELGRFEESYGTQDADARELLEELLETLSPSDQQIVRLLVEGSDLDDIAGKTGLTYGAAAVRVHRIRLRLRGKMSPGNL